MGLHHKATLAPPTAPCLQPAPRPPSHCRFWQCWDHRLSGAGRLAPKHGGLREGAPAEGPGRRQSERASGDCGGTALARSVTAVSPASSPTLRWSRRGVARLPVSLVHMGFHEHAIAAQWKVRLHSWRRTAPDSWLPCTHVYNPPASQVAPCAGCRQMHAQWVKLEESPERAGSDGSTSESFRDCKGPPPP